MVIIYFEGKGLNPSTLLEVEAFSKVETVIEDGKPYKIGFKPDAIADFSLARLEISEDLGNDIESVLTYCFKLFNDNKAEIIKSGTDKIILDLIFKLNGEINFLLTSANFNFDQSIPVEVKFSFEHEIDQKLAIVQMAQSLEQKIRRTYRVDEIAKAFHIKKSGYTDRYLKSGAPRTHLQERAMKRFADRYCNPKAFWVTVDGHKFQVHPHKSSKGGFEHDFGVPK